MIHICIPAHNEERTIGVLMWKIRKVMADFGRDYRILVLDDATSSVDAVVEAEIQQALRQVMAGRTTVIVAHRTSTLAIVDNVAFVEDGRVVAFGPHEQLLREVPRYAEVLAATEDAVGV